jgi:hypothetical protein
MRVMSERCCRHGPERIRARPTAETGTRRSPRRRARDGSDALPLLPRLAEARRGEARARAARLAAAESPESASRAVRLARRGPLTRFTGNKRWSCWTVS